MEGQIKKGIVYDFIIQLYAFIGIFKFFYMKKICLYLLILLYFFAGINHFWHPSFYLPIIPPYFSNPVLINYVAGVAEIILAILLIFSTTRKIAAYGIIAMLIAFIPAHIYFIQKGNFKLGNNTMTPIIGWIRLIIIHPLLIAWAWWYRK